MTGDVLMTLGPVRFSVAEGAYRTLSRALTMRTAVMDRAGRSSARQALGLDETIDIEGVCHPAHVHDLNRLDTLRDLARTRQAHMLTDGLGQVWGLYLVERVEERGSVFTSQGVPQRQDFRLSLGAYGEDEA